MRSTVQRLLVAACLVALFAHASVAQNGNDASKVKGFFTERSKAEPTNKPQGFGDSPVKRSSEAKVSSNALEKARRYARSLLRRYDRNKNGRLEREEWIRIRGNPAKSDANGDGVLTVEEIANRVARRPPRSRAKESSAESKSNSSVRKKTSAIASDDRKSYRFTPATERLPKGLPSWFKQRDKDKDGQVGMHEYARKWSDRTVRDFERYDKDGDGLITSAEAARR